MNQSVWIFGYGSLIWDNKEYKPITSKKATLTGAHRSFNRKSVESRGTKHSPGLVLGLEPGGECLGLAILIDIKYISDIDKREGVGKAYIKIQTPTDNFIVRDESGEVLNCVIYLSNEKSKNYIGDNLTNKQKAKIILSGGEGQRGNSRDYLYDVSRNLSKHGIIDEEVTSLLYEFKKLNS